MLRGVRPVIVVALVLALGLLSVLSAQARVSRLDQPAVGSTTHRALTPLKLILPDLAVAKVWVHGSCQLSVLIKNSGKIALSPKQHAAVILRLKLGKKHRDFPLAKIDHRGKLKKPGAKFTFSIPLDGLFKKTGSSRLRAALIFSKKMREAKDGNNTASVRLSTRCKVRAAASEPPSPSAALPVKIKRVYVKKGTVWVVLVRAKGVKLDKKAASIRLAVKLPKGGDAWQLRKVDKTRRLRLGKELHFDTGLKASKASRALVTLRQDKRVVRVSAPLILAAAPARRPARRVETVAGVAAPTRPGRRGVLKYFDAGINITSPAAGDTAIGGWVTVSYEFTGDRPVPETITVVVVKGATVLTIYSDAPFEGGTRRLRYPVDLLRAGTGYKIEIYTELGHWGQSHDFEIREISADGGSGAHGVLHMRAPLAGAVWPRGTTQRIRWKTEPDDDGRAPRDWSIELHWSGGHETVRRSFRPSYDEAAREYYFDYRVSSDHRTGSNFRLVVTAADNPWGTGELRTTSGEFTVPSRSISLRSDFSEPGHTYYYNNDYSIRWRRDGEIPGRMRVWLYYEGRQIRELTRSSPVDVSAGYFRWNIDYQDLRLNGFTRMTGGGYQIGIESVDDPSLTAMGPEFSIMAPYITVIRPRRGDIYYNGDTITIQWMSFHVTGNATIYLHGLDIGSVVLARDVPVSRGTATWRVSYVDPPGSGSGGSTAHPFPEGSGLTISVMVPGTMGHGPPVTDHSDSSFTIRRDRP